MMVEGVQEEVGVQDAENRSPGDARLERCAQHRGRDHDHHVFRSSSISHAPGHVPQHAREWRAREQVLPARGSNIPEPQRQDEERVQAVDELPTCGRDQSSGIGEQNLLEEEQSRV